jgi:hypothetical protein
VYRRINYIVIVLQLNGVSSIIADSTTDNGKFSIVRCIAETLKPHQLIGLESSHVFDEVVYSNKKDQTRSS